ncbi:hypothetical protein BSKO_08488 [Bryopsis sp. KO-2023]|nr:hypothetical protein BSKO_08488 [Bryopsis sp. KO-2023]
MSSLIRARFDAGKCLWDGNRCINRQQNLVPHATTEESRPKIKLDPHVPATSRKLLEIGERNVIFDKNGRCTEVATQDGAAKNTPQFVESIKDAFLPSGYPHSVSPDYLDYQIWTIPTHITGWMSISLVTSSLLRAVGVGVGPTEAMVAAATIKWITKDGVGALGRFLVGGKLGNVFDEDPRRWRMAAESVTTVGLSLEIATAFFPQHFLILASMGNLAKAFGKGMAKPAFRVIQQHFSRGNNIGEVAAKEESWEVVAQVAGLLASVQLLSLIEEYGEWQWVLGAWITVHSAHVALRYSSMYSLQLDSINLARGKRLALHHIQGANPLPNVRTVNKEEDYAMDWSMLKPCIHMGCSVKEAFPAGMQTSIGFDPWQQIFSEEMYLLGWHDGQGWVVLKEGAEELDFLRAAYHCVLLNGMGGARGGELGDVLRSSLVRMQMGFPDFVAQLMDSGWDVDKVVIRGHRIRVKTVEC